MEKTLNVDYKELQKLNREKQSASNWSICLITYMHLIVALKKLNWRHREILAYLLSTNQSLYSLNERNPITPDNLSQIIGKWVKKNIVDEKKVKVEIDKITNFQSQEKVHEELENEIFKEV